MWLSKLHASQFFHWLAENLVESWDIADITKCLSPYIQQTLCREGGGLSHSKYFFLSLNHSSQHCLSTETMRML